MLSTAFAAIASARSKAFFFSTSREPPSFFCFFLPEAGVLTSVTSSVSIPPPPPPSSSSSLSISSSAEMRIHLSTSQNAEASRPLMLYSYHGLVGNNYVNHHVCSPSSSPPSSSFHGRSFDQRNLLCTVSASASSLQKLSAAFPKVVYKNHGISLQRKARFTVPSPSPSSLLLNLSAAFVLHTENRNHSFCTTAGSEDKVDAIETLSCVPAQTVSTDVEGKECQEVSIKGSTEEEILRCPALELSQAKQEKSEVKAVVAESTLIITDKKEGKARDESGLMDQSSHDFTAKEPSEIKQEDEKKHPIHTGGPDHHVTMRVNSRINRSCERIRRKHGLFSRNSVPQELPDLLTVPGIGPRNFEKLVSKGIAKVAELKKLYRDKFLHDESRKMVEYLRSSVGIVHRNHAESIASYVKLCVDEEIKEQLDSNKEITPKQKKKLTICVEGNISVGKTTFLQKISNEIIELRDMVEIVPEPVDKWKDVGPDHFNLLDAFYKEPERYAYTFQNYVFASRLMKEQETSKGMKLLRLMERSIFSDRLVFVRAVHEAKWMNELELRIYESWFDPFISALPGLVPDGFIYLRASPDTCLRRLHMRNRPEEQGVTLEYLRGLHEKHEQCFFPSASSGGILSVSGLPSGPHQILPSPRIRDRVFYLEGDHLHSSIKKVPALILDCEATIDLNRDFEARAEYAQQVAEFYEYLRSNKDSDMHQTSRLDFSQHSSAFMTKV